MKKARINKMGLPANESNKQQDEERNSGHRGLEAAVNGGR
jgi:hypothetical protein